MPTPLYDDVGPPLLVRGYAAAWNVVSHGRHPMRLLPGAADYVGLPTYATFGHNPAQEFADARNGSLVIWQDEYGVAFEAALPPTWSSLGLANGIRAGNFREASCCWDHGRWSTFADEAEGNVETIKRARLVEISVVPAAACPGTAVWLDNEDPADLPPHVRETRARWHEGRVQVQLAARAARAARVQARARAVHQVPASVRAVLAAGKPKAWLADAEALARGRRK